MGDEQKMPWESGYIPKARQEGAEAGAGVGGVPITGHQMPVGMGYIERATSGNLVMELMTELNRKRADNAGLRAAAMRANAYAPATLGEKALAFAGATVGVYAVLHIGAGLISSASNVARVYNDAKSGK